MLGGLNLHDLFELLIEDQIYVIFLVSIMIIGKIFVNKGIAVALLEKLLSLTKNKRGALFLLYTFSGIIPVPGRVIMTAPILSGMAGAGDEENDEGRSRLGVMNYIMSHHYYFWSPMEESVIIILGATGLSYMAYLGVTLPFLLVYVAFMLYLLFTYLKDEDLDLFDINIDNEGSKYSAWLTLPFILGILQFMYFGGDDGIFVGTGGSDIIGVLIMLAVMVFYVLYTKTKAKEAFSYIKWSYVAILFFVILIGNFIKSHNGDFLTMIQNSGLSIALVSLLAFGVSFLMGSSGKYAGIVALLAKVYGNVYLPLFFIVDYLGYLLSPAHKCVALSCGYFGTKLKDLYKKLFILAGLLIIVVIPFIIKHFFM